MPQEMDIFEGVGSNTARKPNITEALKLFRRNPTKIDTGWKCLIRSVLLFH